MHCRSTQEKDKLVEIIDDLSKGSRFLWIIFILTLTPTIFNGMHSMSYVFTTELPPYWCSVPELTSANWTVDQIKRVSSASPCELYDYNYTFFAQIGYKKATKYIENLSVKPDSIFCSRHTFANISRTTIVEEWDLVCDKAVDRANTYTALSLGKLMGAGFFGVFADRHGRKTTYVIGILVLIISSLTTSYIPWFWSFLILRFLTGVSLSAIGYSSMTILTESSSSEHRQWMGIAFNVGYPIGMAILSGLAYCVNDWKQLQLVVSSPSLILLFHAWLMPESPRWLLSQGRYKKALRIVEQYYETVEDTLTRNSHICDSREIEKKIAEPTDKKFESENENCIRSNIASLKTLYSYKDLRRRMFIMYFSWMTSSLCYYVIALNVDNFSVNHYIYVLIMGITEVPAYFVPSAILVKMGRRHAGALLYIVGGICLLCILAIPRNDTVVLMCVALTGRFILSAGYGITILYTSELFPTVVRNSAVGTSSVMAHVGTITAPYITDLLGQISWWVPSTLCGGLAIIAGITCFVLPETRRRTLADTVEEEFANGRDTVSFRKLWFH